MASGRRRSNTYTDEAPHRSAPRDEAYEAYPTSTNYYDTQPPPYAYDNSNPQRSAASGGRTYNDGGYAHEAAGQPPFPPPPEEPVKRSKSHKHSKTTTAKPPTSDKATAKGYGQYIPQFDRAKASARTRSFGKQAFNKVGDVVEAYAAAQGYPDSREPAQTRRGRSEATRYEDPIDSYHLPRKYSHNRGGGGGGRDRDRDRDRDRGDRRHSSPSLSPPPRRRGKKSNNADSQEYDYDGRPVPRRSGHNRRQSYSLSPAATRRRRDPSPEAPRGRRRPDHNRQPSYSVSPPPRHRRERGPLDYDPEDYQRGRGRHQSERRQPTYSLSPSPDRHDRRGRKHGAGGKPNKYAAGAGAAAAAAAASHDKYGRSKSSNPTDAQRRWQLAAAAALKAGGSAAFGMRSQPGNWVGDKGVRVATAALSAAAMDAFMKQQEPPRQQKSKSRGMRDQAQSVLGSFIASQVMNKAGGGGGGRRERY